MLRNQKAKMFQTVKVSTSESELWEKYFAELYKEEDLVQDTAKKTNRGDSERKS